MKRAVLKSCSVPDRAVPAVRPQPALKPAAHAAAKSARVRPRSGVVRSRRAAAGRSVPARQRRAGSPRPRFPPTRPRTAPSTSCSTRPRRTSAPSSRKPRSRTTKTPGSEAQKIGDFYDSFMNEARAEQLGIAPLKAELDAIDAHQDQGRPGPALRALLQAQPDQPDRRLRRRRRAAADAARSSTSTRAASACPIATTT